jgi:predicted deacetylase
VRQLAVALHDVEPESFERCAEIRAWLAARGVERATLLVVPAPRLHPFGQMAPDLADWLRERVRLGDAVAQHGLEHRRRRGRGGLRAGWLGGPSAEFAALDSEEAGHALDTGLRILRGAGLAPRGFVAPAYYYSRGLRREVERRFAWYAGLWRVHGASQSGPALCLGSSSPLKRATSPLLVRAGARLAGGLLRLDVHPADFNHRGHMAALEEVLRRAARRLAVTYDELAGTTTASSSRRRRAATGAHRSGGETAAVLSRAGGAPPSRPR